MEECLNDMRQHPSKYKESYPCDFETVIAPMLASEGDRLPLDTSSPTIPKFLRMYALTTTAMTVMRIGRAFAAGSVIFKSES
jgi:hypothetical protein